MLNQKVSTQLHRKRLQFRLSQNNNILFVQLSISSSQITFQWLTRALTFVGDVTKESAVLGWLVENTQDTDDPTENSVLLSETRKMKKTNGKKQIRDGNRQI
jgi:hypothetical protein